MHDNSAHEHRRRRALSSDVTPPRPAFRALHPLVRRFGVRGLSLRDLANRARVDFAFGSLSGAPAEASRGHRRPKP